MTESSREAATARATTVDLALLEPADMLSLFGRILDELHARGVVRSTNNPVADYSEYLVAKAFDLKLVPNANAGYDAVSDDGVRYQVKARRLTKRHRSRQLGFVRGFQGIDEPFDFLVAVLFEDDFAIHRAAMVPVHVVRVLAARVEYVNAWRMILSDKVWLIDGVRDVTEEISRAAGQAHVAVATSRAVSSDNEAIGAVTWSAALERYATSRRLTTAARGQIFHVTASHGEILVTPSSGRARRIRPNDLSLAATLLAAGDLRALRSGTWNSSYLEAIVRDLASESAPSDEEDS